MDGIDTPKGTAKIAAGMSLDALDGLAARYLPMVIKSINPSINTERFGPSTFGNQAEHTMDKIKTVLVAANLWGKNMAPKSMIATLAILEVAKAAATVTLYARHAKEESFDAKPTDSGRFGNALMLAGLGLETIINLVDKHNKTGAWIKILRSVGQAAFVAGTALTLDATQKYFGRLKPTDSEHR
ncbi:hypothetical protein FWC31_00465 [Candidatus Saccharibacteria bacterium]|nr:hypothetical protein [Candidatus Saccharibacteria bacterium]